MELVRRRVGRQAKWLPNLFACLFACSCLILGGCASGQSSAATQGTGGVTQKTIDKSSTDAASRVAIGSINDVPDALAAAMTEVKGCKMNLEPANNGFCYLDEGSEHVGSVELSEDSDSFTIYIDGDRSNESSDRALERVAHMTLASVLACNPDYDYSKAQDVAVKIIEADGEYRDGKISYKAGQKSYQYILIVYL